MTHDTQVYTLTHPSEHTLCFRRVRNVECDPQRQKLQAPLRIVDINFTEWSTDNALEKRTEKNRIERLVVAGQPAGLGIRGQGTKGCLLFLSKRNPPAPKCSSDAALIAQSRFFGPRSSALIYIDRYSESGDAGTSSSASSKVLIEGLDGEDQVVSLYLTRSIKQARFATRTSAKTQFVMIIGVLSNSNL
ncbi:predicted protein [Histoplasma capsulatum var. duboisii H88]|uniref:Predicted protein n=1 Tax=Ajellomyces capsulatus (strain H88) TaxID=544711 RepID=F0UF07_AJEC8|nr:predicted protein [Histoplasma capsulatum var. duboisii H88]